MSKYGKRPGVVPDLSIRPPQDPTPAELCPPGEDHNEQYYVELGDNVRIFIRNRSWRNQLVEFAMTLEVRADGAWHHIMRADTCHREVHAHFFDRRGGEKRVRFFEITDIASVARGYDLCYDRLLGSIDANVQAWVDG